MFVPFSGIWDFEIGNIMETSGSLHEQTTLGYFLGQANLPGGDVLKALKMPHQTSDVTEDLLSTVAKFVFTAYLPNIPELRLHPFCEHMAEEDKLPPTHGALKQRDVLRAHIQSGVWSQPHIAQQ